MSAKGFVLLWSTILDSSVWMQDAPTRLVWITMLAMKDGDGLVKASVPGLAHRARVSLEECRTALEVFSSPDPDSTSKIEEGRKIREAPGGWFIINHEAYRYSSPEKLEYWRKKKAEQREAKKPKKWQKKTPPLPGEAAYIRGIESGTINEDGTPVEPKEEPKEYPED